MSQEAFRIVGAALYATAYNKAKPTDRLLGRMEERLATAHCNAAARHIGEETKERTFAKQDP